MTTSEWLSVAGLIVTIALSVGGTTRWLLGLISSSRKDLETTLGAYQGRTDMDISQLREDIGKEFLRTREFEISQRNTERRLESIESEVKRVPDYLDRQSERLIAALRDSRPKNPPK